MIYQTVTSDPYLFTNDIKDIQNYNDGRRQRGASARSWKTR